MNTVSPLKRPFTVSSDSFKLLVCKFCLRDDNILSLKTCGCLFCRSCDGDSRDICISCRSKVDPKIKLSFSKNAICKFYEHNKCYSSAEYKCQCLPNCFVCISCLNYIHNKRLRGSCAPENLRPNANIEPCQLCKQFIADFKMTSEPYSKICFDCKTNRTEKCIPYENNSDKDPDWNQFYKDFEQASQRIANKIKEVEQVLELSSSGSEQEIQKCESAISEIRTSMEDYKSYYANLKKSLKPKLADSKKDVDYLRSNGTIKIILDLLKTKQLTLHGEQGAEQIRVFFNYYQEKNDYNLQYPIVAEKIKTFILQNDSSRQHLLKFPLSGVSTKSDVSVQEIIDNKVKPFVILVEKQSTVNERKKILEDIEKHQDKWIRKERFVVNEIVIILDADAIGSPKYKRAKILNRGKDMSKVFLLDFGFQTSVKNCLIGEIKEININGISTCFLAQLTGSVNVNCDFKQKDGLPKAQHIHLIN